MMKKASWWLVVGVVLVFGVGVCPQKRPPSRIIHRPGKNPLRCFHENGVSRCEEIKDAEDVKKEKLIDNHDLDTGPLGGKLYKVGDSMMECFPNGQCFEVQPVTTPEPTPEPPRGIFYRRGNTILECFPNGECDVIDVVDPANEEVEYGEYETDATDGGDGAGGPNGGGGAGGPEVGDAGGPNGGGGAGYPNGGGGAGYPNGGGGAGDPNGGGGSVGPSAGGGAGGPNAGGGVGGPNGGGGGPPIGGVPGPIGPSPASAGGPDGGGGAGGPNGFGGPNGAGGPNGGGGPGGPDGGGNGQGESGGGRAVCEFKNNAHVQGGILLIEQKTQSRMQVIGKLRGLREGMHVLTFHMHGDIQSPGCRGVGPYHRPSDPLLLSRSRRQVELFRLGEKYMDNSYATCMRHVEACKHRKLSQHLCMQYLAKCAPVLKCKGCKERADSTETYDTVADLEESMQFKFRSGVPRNSLTVYADEEGDSNFKEEEREQSLLGPDSVIGRSIVLSALPKDPMGDFRGIACCQIVEGGPTVIV